MKHILFGLIAVVATASVSKADFLYQEDFDGAYTPFLDSPQIEVTTIGSGNLNGFTAGTSSAGGSALALTTGNDFLQRTEIVVAELDFSGELLENLLLNFSVAADPNDFESSQIDNLQILLDGFSAPLATFLPNSTSSADLSNGVIDLNRTFVDVVVPFSAFTGLTQADLSDVQIAVSIGSSSGAEHIGVDSIAVSAVPEPSSAMIMGLGALAVGATYIRRRKAANKDS